MMIAVVLYNPPSEDAPADERDVLDEANAVYSALEELNFRPILLAATLDLQRLRNDLLRLRPAVVFNLVEALDGVARLAHLVPALLETLRLPFTGGSAAGMLLSTDKLAAKKRLLQAGLAAPARWLPWKNERPDFPPPYIIKPIYEDASVGIDAQSVVTNEGRLLPELEKRIARFGECFVEAYIPGREFNISVILEEEPLVLPLAEIRFVDYPEGKPHIVDYAAKWDEHSFEARHTVRSFSFEEKEEELLQRVRRTAVDCALLFDDRGYLRVDMRVDKAGCPWVLEVNVNPCISPDAGFVAAADQAGMSYTQMIERLVRNALLPRT